MDRLTSYKANDIYGKVKAKLDNKFAHIYNGDIEFKDIRVSQTNS